MAKLTIVFGVLLAALGLFFFYGSDAHAPTSLIPTWWGLALILFGFLADRATDAKGRMLWMHIAVTLGLLGFIFPFARAVVPAIHMAQGAAITRPRAVIEELAMALLCLVLTALCVRSFIAARRARA